MSRRWRTLAVVVVTTLGLATAATAQDTGDLGEARRRVAAIADELEQAETRSRAAGEELGDAEQRLAEVEAVVNDVARRLEQQRGRVADAEDDLVRLRDEATAAREAFEARMIDLFKRAYGSDLAVILSSQDIQGVIDRSELIEVVNRSDRATIEQVEAAEARVATQREALVAETEHLEAMQDEQRAVLAQVRRIRRSKAMAAADAAARVVELEARKEDLEADQQRIEALVRNGAAPPPAPTAVVSGPSAGGYVWPTCGGINSEYGRRWGRLHAGIDIDDDRTSAIVAAKSGTVIFTGYSGGYGNLTLIDHHDGVVTAYGHQAAIAVSAGQSVTTGQRIGTIGSTGHSTGPHLHFETRVNGAPVDPRRYLPAEC